MASWLRGSSAQAWNAQLQNAFSQAATSVQRLAEQAHEQLPDEEQLKQFGQQIKSGAQTIATQANAALEAAEDTLIGGISELAGVLDPADAASAAGLTGAKLEQLFQEEARSLPGLSIVEVLTALKSWASRLEDQGRVRADVLRALLGSRALVPMLQALADLKAGRAALRVAAGLDATKDGNSAAPVAAEAGAALRVLLARSSKASPELQAKLVAFLADAASDAALEVGEQGKAHAKTAGAPEVRRALWFLEATFSEAQEVETPSRGNRGELLETCLGAVGEARARLAAAPPGGGEHAAPKAGDEAWAEWPGDGRWFRARVERVEAQEVFVEWLPAPLDIQSGQDDEYLSPATGSGVQQSTLQPHAVRPGVGDRPSAAIVAEAEWPQAVAAADVLSHSFNELRGLCEELSKGQASGETGEDVTVKVLEERRAALDGLRSQMEASAAEAPPSEQKEERAAALAAERAELSGRAAEIQKERDALLAKLEALDEEAQANKAAVSKCDKGLRSLGLGDTSGLSTQEQQALFKEVDLLLAQRLSRARGAADSCSAGVSAGRLPEISNACLESERLRRRRLEELSASLHAACWGPEAEAIVRDPVRLEAVRGVVQGAGKIVEHAWREMVQMAAESFGDGGAVGGSSEDASRSAKRYKEMKQGLQANLDRLAKLELNQTKAAPQAAAQAPVMGFVPPGRMPSNPAAPIQAAQAAPASGAGLAAAPVGSPEAAAGSAADFAVGSPVAAAGRAAAAAAPVEPAEAPLGTPVAAAGGAADAFPRGEPVAAIAEGASQS